MKNKFWNFVDNGDVADLQLFGTISSEEDWWSDNCTTYRQFIEEMNALGKKGILNVLIQSGGGDVFAANAIYESLVNYKEKYKAKIVGTILGLCASAATIPLMACDERRIAKNGILMAHNPTITLRGSYESQDLLKLADVTEKVKTSIMEAYKERLGKTEDEISALMDEESWYVGQEAIDNGFCDVLIGEDIQNNVFDNKILTMNGIEFNFRNYIDNFVPSDIREKVLNLSETKHNQEETGTFFNKNNNKKGMEKMGGVQKQAAVTIENAAQLKSAYPDFCNEIVENALKEERERLKAIDSIANGISDEILAKAKYEEPISAAELAFAQMQANNQAGQQVMNTLIKDLQESGASDVGAVPNMGNNSDEQMQQKEEKIKGFANMLKKDKRRG